MMRLPPFSYRAPTSVRDAVELLAEAPPGQAAVVAGGTDLFPNMKRRQQEPSIVVGLRRIGALRTIASCDDGGLAIGATVSLARLASDPEIVTHYPALAMAAGSVSTPHLRLMGTVGGNLCLDTRCNYYDQSYHWRKSIDFCKKKDGDVCWVAPGSARCWAVSSSDTAPVAVALDARLRLVSTRGERIVAARDFFRDDGILYLSRRPDELLTELLLQQPGDWRSVYLKLRRRGSFDFPILGVACAARVVDGMVADLRLVLGAVASAPVDQSTLARAAVGHRPDAELVRAIAAEAYRGAHPLDNTDLNYAWRKKMARVYVERALAAVFGVELDG
jgi:4-hydroxybenzoyl-CoA reductase subunit beta